VSEASIRRWSDAGLLNAQRVGRRRERRFAPVELRRFLGHAGADCQENGPPATPTTVTLGRATLPLGSHLAPIYSTDAGGLPLAVPFLAEGLKAGQPCFLAATGATLDRYAEALADEHGLDLATASRNGQVVVLSGAEDVTVWERLFGRALASGPTVLRMVGEMACVRQRRASDDDMMALEEDFDLMAKRFPTVSLCQYDARKFNGEMVLRALKTHPDIFDQHLGGFLT